MNPYILSILIFIIYKNFNINFTNIIFISSIISIYYYYNIYITNIQKNNFNTKFNTIYTNYIDTNIFNIINSIKLNNYNTKELVYIINNFFFYTKSKNKKFINNTLDLKIIIEKKIKFIINNYDLTYKSKNHLKLILQNINSNYYNYINNVVDFSTPSFISNNEPLPSNFYNILS